MYKIGDKVEIIGIFPGGIIDHTGKTGVVISIDKSDYTDMPFCVELEDGNAYWATSENIKHV